MAMLNNQSVDSEDPIKMNQNDKAWGILCPYLLEILFLGMQQPSVWETEAVRLLLLSTWLWPLPGAFVRSWFPRNGKFEMGGSTLGVQQFGPPRSISISAGVSQRLRIRRLHSPEGKSLKNMGDLCGKVNHKWRIFHCHVSRYQGANSTGFVWK